MKRKQIIRDNFREAVFKRDGYKCRKCGKKQTEVKLDAHHITNREDMPNGGYVVENGISLCDAPDGCHMKAEQFYISQGDFYEEGFHPNDLYTLVGSSYQKAYKASERLK